MRSLAFLAIAAIASIPTALSATEGNGQRNGEQSYERRGNDEDWDRQMKEREGHYGRADPDDREMDYDYDQEHGDEER